MGVSLDIVHSHSYLYGVELAPTDFSLEGLAAWGRMSLLYNSQQWEQLALVFPTSSSGGGGRPVCLSGSLLPLPGGASTIFCCTLAHYFGQQVLQGEGLSLSCVPQLALVTIPYLCQLCLKGRKILPKLCLTLL